MHTGNSGHEDEEDGPFEVPESHTEACRPGFKPAAKARKEGSKAELKEHPRFPRVAAKKDVPQESLAARIARRMK